MTKTTKTTKTTKPAAKATPTARTKPANRGRQAFNQRVAAIAKKNDAPQRPELPPHSPIVHRAAPTDTAGTPLVRTPDGALQATDTQQAEALRELGSRLAHTPADDGAEAAAKLSEAAMAPKRAKAKPAANEAEVLGPAEAIELPAYVLRAAILMAAGKGDARHYLQGVHLVARDEFTLRVEATDGHALYAQDIGVERAPSWSKGAGVILDRERLGAALKIAGKGSDDEEPSLVLSFGTNHPHMLVTVHPNAWATVRVALLDGKYPDTDKVAEGAGAGLDDSDRVPLTSQTLNPKLVALATKIAGELGVEGVTPFLGRGAGATVFAFGTSRAVLYVMPIRGDGENGETHLPLQTARMIGAKGMGGSIGALKAHATRTRQAARAAKDKAERDALNAKATAYEERIAKLAQALGKALPAPAAA